MEKTSTTTSQETIIKKVELPKDVTQEMLRGFWDTSNQQYLKIRKNMKLLDEVDSGGLWTRLCKKFPQYQIAPDTNHVNFVKENILASIYTVGKSANLVARSQDQVANVDAINKVLDHIWDVLDVPSYQQQAGERAALLNLGVTQVGWNEDLIGGTHSQWYKGDVVFKNINPMNYARDPFSNTLDDAEYVITFEKHKISNLMRNKDYRDVLKGMIDGDHFRSHVSENIETNIRDTVEPEDSSDKSGRLVIFWVKVPDLREDTENRRPSGFVIHEIHTLDVNTILKVVEDIDINIFPFSELYCNEPGTDLVGQSEPAKILSSSMVANILQGLIATHAYKAQRPPKFLNTSSGINVRNFAKYGNDPDMTWLVNSDASKAVHYGEFPTLAPETFNMIGLLDQGIKNMSGIDERYTGKDTGSLQTTGGMEAMLAQSTMRDTTKINLYEAYSRRLSRLVIKHLVFHADKRGYITKNRIGRDFDFVEINFPAIPQDTEYDYALHISTHLPKSRMRMDAAADAIMEKSMQYQDPTGQTPPLITPEEWLSMKDFPNKDLMLERMRMNRTENKAQEFAELLSVFMQLVSKGVSPEEAFNQVIDVVENGGLEEEGGNIGSTGNSSTPTGGFGGSVQARQAG